MDKEFLGNLGLTEEAAEAVLQQLETEMAEHQAAVQQLKLEHGVAMAVQRHGGRNLKAISALLDMEKLGGSDDLAAEFCQANGCVM